MQPAGPDWAPLTSHNYLYSNERSKDCESRGPIDIAIKNVPHLKFPNGPVFLPEAEVKFTSI